MLPIFCRKGIELLDWYQSKNISLKTGKIRIKGDEKALFYHDIMYVCSYECYIYSASPVHICIIIEVEVVARFN